MGSGNSHTESTAANRRRQFWASAQMWLQGHGYPPPYRPWIAWRLGNLISDVRYWTWRLTGGSHDA